MFVRVLSDAERLVLADAVEAYRQVLVARAGVSACLGRGIEGDGLVLAGLSDALSSGASVALVAPLPSAPQFSPGFVGGSRVSA